MIVQKKDLQNNYELNQVVQKSKKERNMWMWIVLVGCFLFQMLPYCVALNLTSVFVGSDWQIWTGNNQTIISVTFTVGAVAAALAGPFIAGLLNRKINMRVVYSIGIVLGIIGFVGSAFNSVLIKTGVYEIVWVPTGKFNSSGEAITIPRVSQSNIAAVSAILWISNIISQIGVMIFSGLGVNNLISKWWPAEKRGFALGVAFTGGSIGNIWMQQLVGLFAKNFGNGQPGPEYNPFNNQYATYMIMGLIGLVGGLLACMVICRKPLPSIDILEAKSNDKDTNNAVPTVLEASPLVTQKYPPYWIIAVGYLILQMGTVHAAGNASLISKGLLIANDTYNPFGVPQKDVYNQLMATCGTVFGVSCLVGNFGGGVLNDKLGPAKSIFLAGMIQCVAIFCLMFSVKTPEFVYVYFVLSGLSVYVYTSTPSFISGKLYGAGQSNSHMAILGLFIALGYAIVNPIAGAITGQSDATNIHYMFGQKVYGNWLAWGIFAISCMGVGTIIVSTCCAIITNKGIKGLLEYSPTKYSRVILFKHNISLKWNVFRINVSGKDYRVNNEERNKKIQEKNEKDMYYNSINVYKDVVASQLKSKKLSDNEIKALSTILYFGKIDSIKVGMFADLKSTDKEIKALLDKKLIAEHKLGMLGTYYTISETLANDLSSNINELNNKYVKLNNERIALDNKLASLDAKAQAKVEKINAKLEEVKNSQIDESSKQALVEKSDALVQKYTNLRQTKLAALDSKNADDWSKYKVDYEYSERINTAKALANKLEIAKENKIMSLQKKLGATGYVSNFNKKQQIDGNFLLLDYYNNVTKAYDDLITKRVDYKLEQKEDILNSKKAKCEAKLNKISKKQASLDAQFKEVSKTHDTKF